MIKIFVVLFHNLYQQKKVTWLDLKTSDSVAKPFEALIARQPDRALVFSDQITEVHLCPPSFPDSNK